MHKKGPNVSSSAVPELGVVPVMNIRAFLRLRPGVGRLLLLFDNLDEVVVSLVD